LVKLLCRDLAAAEAVLTSLRGSPDVEFELQILQLSKVDSLRESAPSFWSLFAHSVAIRRSLLIGLTLQLTQQFSGINAVFYYSTAFFEKARVSDPWLGSVLASSINFLATALAIPLMDRTGRRVLLIVSCVGMMVSCWFLTAALYVGELAESVWLSTISVFGVLGYVCFFEVGLGPIPWLIGAEIYPSSIRAIGMSASAVVNWSTNFIISLTFPHLNNYLTIYTFLPFSAVLALATVFILLVVPETRGQSLQEIQRSLGGEETDELEKEGELVDDDGSLDEDPGEGGCDSELSVDVGGFNHQLISGGYTIDYDDNFNESDSGVSGGSTPLSSSSSFSRDRR